MACTARKWCSASAANGSRTAIRVWMVPEMPCRRRLAALVRRSVGLAAYTSRIVSLNWRTLRKPAAKATSAKVRSVVSISTRAVWARRDRARASGPAPYCWVTTRLSWRVE